MTLEKEGEQRQLLGKEIKGQSSTPQLSAWKLIRLLISIGGQQARRS